MLKKTPNNHHSCDLGVISETFDLTRFVRSNVAFGIGMSIPEICASIIISESGNECFLQKHKKTAAKSGAA